MRTLLLMLTALAVSGCAGSPMGVYSRTGPSSEFTARQLETIELNRCNGSSPRCSRGGD